MEFLLENWKILALIIGLILIVGVVILVVIKGKASSAKKNVEKTPKPSCEIAAEEEPKPCCEIATEEEPKPCCETVAEEEPKPCCETVAEEEPKPCCETEITVVSEDDSLANGEDVGGAEVEITAVVEADLQGEGKAKDEQKFVYNRSFEAKISQADDSVKSVYSELKNRLLSYKKISSRISWKCDAFNWGRIKICRLSIKGKNIVMNVALDPEKLSEKYHHKSDANKAKLAAIPTQLKIKSARSLKYAKELIDMAMAEKGIELRKKFTPTDYVAMYPCLSTEELVEKNLIKAKESNGNGFLSDR